MLCFSTGLKLTKKRARQKQALTLFKRVKEEFPQTYYGYDATAKVTELEQKK